MAGVWARRLRAAMWHRALLLLLWLTLASVQGLYFHIGETEKRCFIEEIPDETMVIGNYRTQLWDKQTETFLPSTPGLGMHVEVKDPDGKRVHLDIQVGEHTNNYPEIAAKDKLTELQLRARQLLDQVEQIQKEQNYQRFREERFRMTSESTNQRVLWWSIAQTVILILTGIWQMRHLKSFFEAKKLV
ncbi:transmembrane emp24 domain-containing protein 4 isoform X2 [Phascolarctos cinereus]|uniref:Transmembrane emp24 domain-containing protein 4 isoform X2 n=1 Tax=Phascolarctos cinereus TaxID=38626 RepID=A0A6P5K3X0_PHACI|nr:transmembrane emp24 domain-containing protein 4 isoform X2 [Phascolarctos cinereus]